MGMRKKVLGAAIILAILWIPVPAQDMNPANNGESVEDDGPVPSALRAPLGFAGIEMGMELDLVKEQLMRDSQFRFRGDPDVSMLTRRSESLIETEGISFIKRAYFQFYEGRLFTIILALNPDKLDHYTMYTLLVERYGEPVSLDPTQAVWEFDAVRMVLERPLSVKYIDSVVFDEILKKNAQTESLNALSRERFLDQF